MLRFESECVVPGAPTAWAYLILSNPGVFVFILYHHNMHSVHDRKHNAGQYITMSFALFPEFGNYNLAIEIS